MKPITTLLAVASCFFCAGLFAQENRLGGLPAPVQPTTAPTTSPSSPPLRPAETAATQWLAAVDAGDYALSWRAAAGRFQQALTQAQWSSALQTNRSPLGGMQSRVLQSATFLRTLAGLPDGEYMQIQYQTQFAFKLRSVETLTLLKDQDNTWKVAGYFIK